MRVKKVAKKDNEISYWLSFSDLMSGLLIIFILLSVYMLLDYRSAAAELEITKHTLAEYTSMNTNIIEKLKAALGNSISIDSDTGTLILDSELLFDTGKSELKPAGKAFLNEIMPAYFRVLFKDAEIKDSIASITIEGYTDDQGTYEYGLYLSYNRALSVYYYMLNDPGFEDYHKDMKELIILTGRSEAGYLPLNENETIEEWRKRNRRVEIKFDLKYREIYKQLEEYLNNT
ncbi:MAG: OmpA family protein [Eubacteriales bacterium]|nr:OmpA family protein [Eubacteriales bacterium]